MALDPAATLLYHTSWKVPYKIEEKYYFFASAVSQMHIFPQDQRLSALTSCMMSHSIPLDPLWLEEFP
jgi:hypothetical protein